MDYVVAVLLPQLLHGLVFGAALGLLALGLTVIFGLLGVMNFAHGELYMLGAYAGIAVIGVTHSFWVALVVGPVLVGALAVVTEVATLRPVYRREPLYGLTLTFAGSAALAALAGLLLAPVFTVYPQMGVEMILLAFIVVILGGMGSISGSVVAAFVIGIAQSLLTLWMNPQRVAIAIFGIMILVLIIRPRGFFGREGVLE